MLEHPGEEKENRVNTHEGWPYLGSRLQKRRTQVAPHKGQPFQKPYREEKWDVFFPGPRLKYRRKCRHSHNSRRRNETSAAATYKGSNESPVNRSEARKPGWKRGEEMSFAAESVTDAGKALGVFSMSRKKSEIGLGRRNRATVYVESSKGGKNEVGGSLLVEKRKWGRDDDFSMEWGPLGHWLRLFWRLRPPQTIQGGRQE